MQEIKINKLELLDYYSDENYKRLRTNIQFSGENIKVIAITSCIPNEGKSSVSFNLARSLAETGKKVLFIDADMRKSVLVGRLKLQGATKGLTHYLAGQCKLEEVLCATNVPMLHMIPAGPAAPNPAELLTGSRMEAMVTALRGVYDYVIIDTPPVGSVIDGAVIGRSCDGVVLVIAAGKISYKLARRIKEQLEMTDCHILGAVLNMVERKEAGYGGSRYQEYYKYYGSKGAK